MKLLLIILNLILINAAQADVVVSVTEDPPASTLPPVSKLPPEPVNVALEYNNTWVNTPWGPVSFTGGYIGEGPYDYKMRAVLTCKNGRKLELFNLKFCDFKKNPKVLKDNFEVNLRTSTIRFNYLATKKPNAQGGVSCSNGANIDKKVYCGPR